VAPVLRIAIVGLLALCPLAPPAAAVASGSGGAHASIGFEPIPLSIAIDAVGHVYLSNPQRSGQVQQYSSDGTLLANWGSFARSGSAFRPRDIATDAAGDLYVADSTRGLLYVLGPDGGPRRQWKADGHDLAVGPEGVVNLLDSHEVQRFAPDGALLSKWGASGDGDGQLGEAWGIDISPSGLVYVADTYSSRIQVFTADGTFVTKWGRFGSDEGQFVYPYGIATDAAGDVYVADTANARIQKFTGSGVFLGSWGGHGRGPGRFYTPTSVATDPAGFVYVADAGEPYPDPGGARVQKFTASGEFVAEWGDIPERRPPRPRFSGTIGRRTTKHFATFRFYSPQEGARFQCRLSGERVPVELRPWRACSSPKRYAQLRPGHKLFHLRALAPSGISGQVRRSWLIVG
jgi:sugar lactone lactonase YvrE